MRSPGNFPGFSPGDSLGVVQKAKLCQGPADNSTKPACEEEEMDVNNEDTSRPATSILQFSTCTKTGEPATYKLPLELAVEHDSEKLFKYNIGSPRPGAARPLPEKVLMVVGATGAGKSTLINGMANYVLGVKWGDNFRFKVTTDEGNRSQAESQTTNITAYTFHSTTKPFVLTIIDTPGFGDTHGIERDKEIKEQIHQFFSKGNRGGIDQLHGIGFVVQSSLPRLSPAQEYIFNAVLSIFGKDIIDNIFIMATFADGSEPAVLEAVKKAKIPYKESFQFNNIAIYASNKSSGFDFNPMFWQMSYLGFDNFFSKFTLAEPKSLALTREVLKERQQLEGLIPSLQEQVRIALSKLSDIEKEKRTLREHEADIQTNKNFTYTVTKAKCDKVSLTGVYTTNCLKCSFTCHDNCVFPNDSEKARCGAMSNGYCRYCPGHCHWTSHSNIPFRFVWSTENETRTNHDLKKKCEVAKSGKVDVEATIKKFETKLEELQTTVFSKIQQATQSIKRLEEIALKPNPLDELKYIDLLIQSEEDQQKPGYKSRVAQYQNIRKNAQLMKKVPKVAEGKNLWAQLQD